MEENTEQSITNILSEAWKQSNPITIITGKKGYESFELFFLAQSVIQTGQTKSPVNKMPRKAKKKIYGTISYRKKNYPDFGCPLSADKLRKIVEQTDKEQY